MVYLDDRHTIDQPAATPYKEHSMSKDAMSGGSPYNSSTNAYTLHTPASLQSAQQFFEQNCEFSTDSATGYKKWDPETQKMVDYALALDIKRTESSIVFKDRTNISQDKLNHFLSENDLVKIDSYNGHWSRNIYIPKANQKNENKIIEIVRNSNYDMTIHFNDDRYNINKGEKLYLKSNGQSWEKVTDITYSKKPYKQGIPVVTLLGYYDPQNQLQSFIAPPLEGSYGMVYHPGTVNSNGTFLRVTFANGETKDYSLNQHRSVNDRMNKFHINIERELTPIKTELFIKGTSVVNKDIKLSDNILNTTINGNSQ